MSRCVLIFLGKDQSLYVFGEVLFCVVISCNDLLNQCQSYFGQAGFSDHVISRVFSYYILSPYKSLPIAQEHRYLGEFSCFIMKLNVVCTH